MSPDSPVSHMKPVTDVNISGDQNTSLAGYSNGRNMSDSQMAPDYRTLTELNGHMNKTMLRRPKSNHCSLL